MNQAHIHLLINHLPIFGSLFGGMVLAFALLKKNNQTKIAAYYILILSSLGAIIAYKTGEEAEEIVENIKGVSKNLIEQHDHFALIALISLIILGVVSLIAIFLTIKNHPLSRKVASITLFLSIICFVLIARTGYLGGQIRHNELNSNSVSLEQGEDSQDGDKD